MTRLIAALSLFTAAVPLPYACLGAPEIDEKIRKKNDAFVTNAYQADLKEHKDNADFMIRPGLLADKKTRRIRIYAEASGLTKYEITEFFLIDKASGHAYESIAVSFAKPSDVHDALVFLGVKPGRPINVAKAQFWPKGERIIMTFARQGDASAKPVRAETLIAKNQADMTMPETGLVFVGSYRTSWPAKSKTLAYAADVLGPLSLASTYNESTTLLDVPRMESQHDVYKQRLMNPKHLFKPGELLEVVLTPEYGPKKRRVVDVSILIRPKAGAVGQAPLTNIEFVLKGLKGHDAQPVSFEEALKAFRTAVQSGHDPFAVLDFDPRLMVKTIADVCQVLATIDSANGIRVEPPPTGQPYYKAFVPDETMRGRAKRISQPWELRMALKDDQLSTTLTQIKQVWKDDNIWPDLNVIDHPVDTPEAFREKLATLDPKGKAPHVIFVFADPSVTYGQVMSFIRPVLKTHPIIYVYLGPAQEDAAVKARAVSKL